MTYDEAIAEFHRDLLSDVLRRNHGHCGKAAEELRIHRNTLTRLMQSSGVDLSTFRSFAYAEVAAERREQRAEEQRRELLAELVCEREGLKKEPFRITRMMQLAEMAEKLGGRR